MAILRTKHSNLLGLRIKAGTYKFKYLTESTKGLFQSPSKSKLNYSILRKRNDGLPKEWNKNHHYIGDSWAIHGHRLINIKGKTFWLISVLDRDRTKSSRAYSYWMCQCSCGRRYSIRSDRLRNGEKFCCIECKKGFDQIYKAMERARIRKKLAEEHQIYMNERNQVILDPDPDKSNNRKRRSKFMKRIKVTRVYERAQSHIHQNGRLYCKGNVLEMRDHYGMSIGEIASQLTLEEAEVRKILSDARKNKQEEKEGRSAPKLKLQAAQTGCVYKFKESPGMSPKEVKEYLEKQNQNQSKDQKQSS